MFSIDHPDSLTRREWLRVGALGAAGLGLADLVRARSREQVAPGRAKACILCFLFGAPAHQDIWDLKPDAPAEVRGEFKPIASNVPGIFVGEHIPRTAQQAHRLALLRSVTHPDNTHTVAMHYMLTGQRHLQPNTNPRNQPTDFPTFGAIAQYLDRGKGRLPAGISLNSPANQVSAANHIFPGFFAGFLGSTHDPLFVAQDPSRDDFRPFPSVEGPAAQRLLDRRTLLSTVDRQRQELAASAA